MDMKINSALIKAEREKRAWSQEHLASVAGLGVRTIQRIEASGSGSPESVKALASVLELSVTDLSFVPKSVKSISAKSKRLSIGALVFSIMLSAGLFIANPIFAKTILLDMDVLVEDKIDGITTGETRLSSNELIGEDQTVIVQLPEKLRIEITPSLENKGADIRLVVKVFEKVGEEYSLRGRPQVLTNNLQEAKFRFGSETSTIEMFITPSIQ